MTNLSADQLDQIQGGNIANMFGFLPDLIRYVQQTGVVQAADQYNAMGDYGN